MLIIDYLGRRPEHIETVARWIYDEWTHVTDPDLETQVERCRGWQSVDRVPLCLVALEGPRCVGTISIFEHDLPAREDLTPWLAAFYVDPDYRGRGVGGALMERLLAVARGLGIRRLYLHTETAAAYYRRRGWRFLFECVNDRGERTEVFDLPLDP